jgi:hypothetical protein
MSLFEDVMALAVQMPMGERERLARALGLSVHTKGPGKTLPLNQFVSQPADAAAWRKAETGHAVLATATPLSEADVPEGPEALAGLWTDSASASSLANTDAAAADTDTAGTLSPNSPVIVHTDVCLALGANDEKAAGFWRALPVEARLATATYLTLLGEAQNENELLRVRRFVQPYAVLSLGPMASSRSVELVSRHGLADGLGALDALIAATALAHEIPLVTLNPAPFANIAGLTVLRPY